MKTDLFQFCGHCWDFQICWHIECRLLQHHDTGLLAFHPNSTLYFNSIICKYNHHCLKNCPLPPILVIWSFSQRIHVTLLLPFSGNFAAPRLHVPDRCLMVLKLKYGHSCLFEKYSTEHVILALIPFKKSVVRTSAYRHLLYWIWSTWQHICNGD